MKLGALEIGRLMANSPDAHPARISVRTNLMATSKFLHAPETLAWLSQFSSVDQARAVQLLRSLQLVSADRFHGGLKNLLLKRIDAGPGPVGLYVEREVKKNRVRLSKPLFEQTTQPPIRAFGNGPAAVCPMDRFDPTVGSEGLIAQLLGEVQKLRPKKCATQPGPDRIRKHTIRRFMLVTDIVGSGSRATQYLDAAWEVSSVKSWHSLGLIRFEVVAYAATKRGRRLVERHPCKPVVHTVTACKSLDDLPGETANDLRSLCISYDPVDHDLEASLGYLGTGLLTVFAHGAPNNCPRLLFKNRPRKWFALFPSRVTSELRSEFEVDGRAEAAEKFFQMRQSRLATGRWLGGANEKGRSLFLVLAALSRGPRHKESVSRRTGLTIIEVEDAIDRAQKMNLIDPQLRVSDRGHRELSHARQSQPDPALPSSEPGPYYPTSLRAPS